MNAKTILCAVTFGLCVLWAVSAANADLTVTTDLVLRLEADMGVTTSGSTVTAWADQSGNGHDATAIGAPTLSGSEISFDGANDAFSIGGGSVLSSQNFTIFAVIKDVSASSAENKNLFSNWHFGDGADYINSVYLGTTTGTAGGRKVRLTNIPSGADGELALNTPSVLVGSVNATTGSSIYDGVTLLGTGAVRTYALNTPTYYTVGDHSNLTWANEKWNGTVSALLVYNAELSAGDRASVTAYLGDKYGITIPEPGTIVMLAAGLVGLLAYAWRKRK